MPSQKECMDINDRMMLSRAARDARAEHCQRYQTQRVASMAGWSGDR